MPAGWLTPCPRAPDSRLQELLIYGKQFGNVFIGVQPTFGYEGDPMRLLFSKSASPHHGFAAYYTYLEKIFGVRQTLRLRLLCAREHVPLIAIQKQSSRTTELKGKFSWFVVPRTWAAMLECLRTSLPSPAPTPVDLQADAVLHFGTHGSLEFMPGKQVRRPRLEQQLSGPAHSTPSLLLGAVQRKIVVEHSAEPLLDPPSFLPPAGGHVWRVLPRLPDRHHPQPLLLCRQQPLG